MNTTLAGGGRVGRGGLGLALKRLGPVFLFGIVPVLLVGGLIVHELSDVETKIAFFDFHSFWTAGNDVLHGRSPYPPADARVLAHENSFVYPAPAAVAMVPFALLSFKVSATLFALLSIGALLLALKVAGVRDWRVYGIALLSRPVLHGITLGAVSPFLALGLAVAWRWRDRRWIAAGAIAALIVLKLFLWPLLLWLAFTRRTATAITAAVLAAAGMLAGWAVLGFAGMRNYPHLLEHLSRLLEGKGYSLVALGLSAGSSAAAARALAAVVGVACLALIAWRARRAGADAWTLAVAVGAALALSPIVWLHYFVLLLVPLAIASPRLGPLWLLPLAFWAIGGQSTDPAVWARGWSSAVSLDTRPVGSFEVVAYGVIAATITLVAAGLAASRATPKVLLARRNAKDSAGGFH